MGRRQTKTKSVAKVIPQSVKSSVVGKVASKFLGGRSKGRKSKKKSALWYAKEIQRLKLKRKYEKTKLGVLR